MYRRFLNNDDYLGIITPEALAQLTRGNDARFIQAEESADSGVLARDGRLWYTAQNRGLCRRMAPHREERSGLKWRT